MARDTVDHEYVGAAAAYSGLELAPDFSIWECGQWKGWASYCRRGRGDLPVRTQVGFHGSELSGTRHRHHAVKPHLYAIIQGTYTSVQYI